MIFELFEDTVQMVFIVCCLHVSTAWMAACKAITLSGSASVLVPGIATATVILCSGSIATKPSDWPHRRCSHRASPHLQAARPRQATDNGRLAAVQGAVVDRRAPARGAGAEDAAPALHFCLERHGAT